MDKNNSASDTTQAPDPSAHAYHAGAGWEVAGSMKRFFAKRERAVVRQLTRGENPEAVSQNPKNLEGITHGRQYA